MEEKDNYTKQEVEQEKISALIAYAEYNKAFLNYCMKQTRNEEVLSYPVLTLDEYKKKLNYCIKECHKTIPKSLIDKLGIKFIE